MANDKLKDLLAGECEILIGNIRMAEPGSPEAKGAMYILQNYHKMLIEEKKVILESEKQEADEKLKRKEMELKEKTSNAECRTKEFDMEMRLKELELKRESNYDDRVFRERDLGIKESDQKLKERQTKEGKKDRIIGYVLTGAGILIPVIASGYWMGRGLKFETTGTYTSRTMQWIGNHFKLFKGKNG